MAHHLPSPSPPSHSRSRSSSPASSTSSLRSRSRSSSPGTATASHTASATIGRGRRRGRARGRGSSGRGRGAASVAAGRGRGSGSRGGRGRSRGTGTRETPVTWTWSSTQDSSSNSSSLTYSGGVPGPTGLAVGVVDPVDCFQLFMTSDFYDEILTQTNLYADQQREAQNDTSMWTPISKKELMAFVGINIAMGIISLPTLNDYWSTDPILAHTWFRTVMSRNRFRKILRNIHVVDNSAAPSRTAPNYDRLWKVRPLLDALSKQCKELYNPHWELSIDESMIGTKCRLSFIQYMPKKPTKWGIKVWVCCDAVTGYIFSFDVYTGADPAKPTRPKGLAYDVVMDLLESRLDNGHAVYMDNFYSSHELFQDLLSQGTAAS